MSCYLFMAGYALTRVHDAESQKDYFRNYADDATYYVARVYDDPTERERNYRAVLQLEYLFGDSLPSRPVAGKVMAYFPKSDSAFSLRYGDLVAFPGPIREVSGPKNPEEFDYRAYLARKGITGQVFLRQDEWLDLQTNNANPIYAFSYRFRDVLLASLQRSGLNDNELAWLQPSCLATMTILPMTCARTMLQLVRCTFSVFRVCTWASSICWRVSFWVSSTARNGKRR